MLLAIDIGNTNIVLGLFAGAQLVQQWRLSTDHRRSADEYRAILEPLAASAGLNLPEQVEAVIIGSVVPPVTGVITAMCRHWLGLEPLVVSVDLDLGLDVRVKEPARVGADRLLNAVAARAAYGAPCITLDLGTATKFDVLAADGAFIGGAIAPGLHTATEALVRGTAQLPSIDFTAPPHPIGDDTTSAMQSGIVLGYLSLIEGLLARIQAALPGPDATVIATGGLAGLILPLTDTVDHHDPNLTLHGLCIIFERNRNRP